MRAVLQRVSQAEVRVGDGVVIGKIGRGFVVLLGVAKDDTEKDAAYIADKTIAMTRARYKDRSFEIIGLSTKAD